MPKIFSLLFTGLLVATLAACAGVSDNPVNVKCPACGYEFDVETKG